MQNSPNLDILVVMRHIIAPPERHHTPTRSFDSHLKVLLVFVIVTHPLISILCQKFASFAASATSFFFGGLAEIYSEERNVRDFNFREISESDSLFMMYLVLVVLVVSVLSGTFRIFRIKKSFLANFFISLGLLLLGFLIFA